MCVCVCVCVCIESVDNLITAWREIIERSELLNSLNKSLVRSNTTLKSYNYLLLSINGNSEIFQGHMNYSVVAIIDDTIYIVRMNH